MLQGQKDLHHRRPADPLRAGAGGRRAAGRVLRARRRPTEQPQLHAAGQLRLRAAQAALGKPVRPRRGPGRPVRAREAEDPARPTCPRDYIRISSGLGEAPPRNIIVLPVVFEGQVKGVLELASFERFNPTHQAFLDQLTEVDRHRAQHDRSQHADRGPAQAVAVAGPASCRAGRKSCSRPTRSCRRRPACSPSRTRKSSARTAKSSRPARRWKRRPSSSR